MLHNADNDALSGVLCVVTRPQMYSNFSIQIFSYSSFQTTSPNILLNIRSRKMIVFSDKTMLISVD